VNQEKVLQILIPVDVQANLMIARDLPASQGNQAEPVLETEQRPTEGEDLDSQQTAGREVVPVSASQKEGSRIHELRLFGTNGDMSG